MILITKDKMPGFFASDFIKYIEENDLYRVQCTLKNANTYITHCYQQWLWHSEIKDQTPIKFAREVKKIIEYIRSDSDARSRIGLLMYEITLNLTYMVEKIQTWNEQAYVMKNFSESENDEYMRERVEKMMSFCSNLTSNEKKNTSIEID